MAVTPFVDFLAAKQALIESYLTEHTPHAGQDAGRSRDDLERYLYQPLDRFTARGGKRTRPALCLLGCSAVGGRDEQAIAVAAAIEEFQSSALIHDDIADKSTTRRGEPCVHVTEGIGLAINAGDLALVTTSATILRDPGLADDVKLRVMGEVVAMEERTLEGQALDLGWVRDDRWDVTDEDYLYMARHKTAYYSGAVPLAVGALCGGGSDEQVEALRSFGLKAGLAFQLQDDLLNLVGEPADQGKDFRSDITEGKRTLVAVWALAHLTPADHDELLGILRTGTTDAGDLARAVELMEAAGSIRHASDLAKSLVADAKKDLAQADFAPEAREILLSMADFFIGRTK